MLDKKEARLRRSRKGRAKAKELQLPRLTVYRTPRNIYAQIILPDGKVVACASTLDKEVKQACSSYSGNVAAAKVVGKFVALRALAAGISKVAFDRSGFKYHGRIKALADIARECGLIF